MNLHYPTNRVQWRNGEVITEDHFNFLELWIEQLLAFQFIYLSDKGGMLRHPTAMKHFNLKKNIFFNRVDNILWRVEIEYFCAVNSFGKPIIIEERKTFELRIRRSDQDADGNLYIYIIPQTNQANQPELVANDDIETDVSLYKTQYQLTTTPDPLSGIPIARFTIRGENIVVDENFIIPTLTTNGSQWAQIFTESLYKSYSHWKVTLETYFKTLQPLPELHHIWTVTSNFLRSTSSILTELHAENLHFELYLRIVRRFFLIMKTDIEILISAFRSEGLRMKASQVIDILDTFQFHTQNLQQYDALLSSLINAFTAITELLSEFPSGPERELTLPISGIELREVSTGNKLLISFNKKEQFVRGKSKIILRLTNFSMATQIREGVKFGMSRTLTFADLEDITYCLKALPTGDGYILEVPPERVDHDSSETFVLFLPRPLGENIDLKKNITVFLKD